MPYYRRVGDVPAKRHTQHRGPDGELYREELLGAEGFSSDSSLLYHVGVPSAIETARPWMLPDQALVPNEPLLPRHWPSSPSQPHPPGAIRLTKKRSARRSWHSSSSTTPTRRMPLPRSLRLTPE